MERQIKVSVKSLEAAAIKAAVANVINRRQAALNRIRITTLVQVDKSQNRTIIGVAGATRVKEVMTSSNRVECQTWLISNSSSSLISRTCSKWMKQSCKMSYLKF